MAEIKTIKLHGEVYDLRDDTKLPLEGGTLTGALKLNTLHAPTASGGSTLGAGSNGQVLKSNGTTVYWANDNSGGSGASGDCLVEEGTLQEATINDFYCTYINETNTTNYVKTADLISCVKAYTNGELGGSGGSSSYVDHDHSGDTLYATIGSSDASARNPGYFSSVNAASISAGEVYLSIIQADSVTAGNLYTKNEIDTKLATLSSGGTIDLSSYATKEELGNYTEYDVFHDISSELSNRIDTLESNMSELSSRVDTLEESSGSGSGASTSSANKTGTKLFLIGATDQSTAPTTYSNSSVFINTSNQVQAAGFYATSDKRLKENIKEFIPKKSILDLPVVEFDFKDSGAHQIGCIAQDLQEICPEIVNTDENGYLSINESKLVYLLLSEVKQLKEEIINLKKSK